MMQIHTIELLKRFWPLENLLELFLPKKEHFIHDTKFVLREVCETVCRNFAGQQTSRSRSGSVGIVNAAWAERCGVRIPVGKKIFFSPELPGRFWGPLNPLFSAYGVLSRG